jgi:hypothetical protein
LKRLNPTKAKPIGDSRIRPLKNFLLGSVEIADAEEDHPIGRLLGKKGWRSF